MEVANKRVAAAQQTRANLIETGLVLAEELGLEGLSVNAVVAGRGRVERHVLPSLPGPGVLSGRPSPPVSRRAVRRGDGGDRATSHRARTDSAAAARTYLDGCLRDRGVKALLLEARGHLPIADEVTRRNRMNVDVVAADFAALGWTHPARSGATVGRGDRGMRADRTRTGSPQHRRPRGAQRPGRMSHRSSQRDSFRPSSGSPAAAR